MKIRRKTVTLAAVLTMCMLLSVFVFAADNSYDSSKDPIAAQSYVDAQVSGLHSSLDTLSSKIAAIEAQLNELADSDEDDNAALKKDVDQLKTELASLKTEFAALKTAFASLQDEIKKLAEEEKTGDTFIAIQLKKGQTIYAKGGAIELILRTGAAKVVSPFNDQYTRQGISDNTNGTEIFNGGSASLNHLLLIPRGDDGRGLTVTSNDGAFLMVRGNYEIK